MQIKRTLKFHLTSGRMAIIKEVKIKAGEEAGKQKEHYTLLVGM
jgi:hypothetical protein